MSFPPQVQFKPFEVVRSQPEFHPEHSDALRPSPMQASSLVNSSGIIPSYLESDNVQVNINQREPIDNRETTWKSCCMSMDKSAVKYFFQVGVLGSIISTSIVMMVTRAGCDEQRNWSAILMLCLGVFVPTPRM